jgi:hypothetical protein
METLKFGKSSVSIRFTVPNHPFGFDHIDTLKTYRVVTGRKGAPKRSEVFAVCRRRVWKKDQASTDSVLIEAQMKCEKNGIRLYYEKLPHDNQDGSSSNFEMYLFVAAGCDVPIKEAVEFSKSLQISDYSDIE